jgi:hypothetical protein
MDYERGEHRINQGHVGSRRRQEIEYHPGHEACLVHWRFRGGREDITPFLER